MGKKSVPYPRSEACRRLGREILGRNGADQPDQTQGNQQKTHPYNIAAVFFCNAHINHSSHYKRHKQFKRRLQHLKERRQYGFFSVLFQIDKR